MLVLNFKTYPEATGANAKKLLDAINDLQMENPSAAGKIYAAVSQIDLSWAKNSYPSLNIISQHVDMANAGSSTGSVPAETVKSLGVDYTVINHSEHRIWNENIVENLNALQAKGLKLIVCCENVEEAREILKANVYAIAYEPKDLIGSGISVTTRPEAVDAFLKEVKGKTVALVGAGVSTQEDVQKCLELGADGALLASAFVKAADHKAKAMELVSPLLA